MTACLALHCPGVCICTACCSILMLLWTDTNVDAIGAQKVLTSNIEVCLISLLFVPKTLWHVQENLLQINKQA